MSKVLEENGYSVLSTDLIDRGYGKGNVDFLNTNFSEKWNGDIVTNPPYKYALDFVKKGLDIIEDGNKIMMFLKIQFLEGKSRAELYKNNNPKYVYVASSRIKCAKKGEFNKYKSSPVAYAWYIWEKGYKGETIVRWFN